MDKQKGLTIRDLIWDCVDGYRNLQLGNQEKYFVISRILDNLDKFLNEKSKEEVDACTILVKV